ncbi:unnamed protein product [Pleuronectes platessa]|uniref:Uncharacterized protein n=1 Tax=Pleuronectes platessa TaxID=8262 RepID=A0A9N7VSE4_PLEPL|nr:unnamed protein product [Pleuronectes platessa]
MTPFAEGSKHTSAFGPQQGGFHAHSGERLLLSLFAQMQSLARRQVSESRERNRETVRRRVRGETAVQATADINTAETDPNAATNTIWKPKSVIAIALYP